MTHFYLIRHGRTAWNTEDRLQGWVDQPLDDIGLAQAGALAAWLHDVRFDALYSSPLLRARQTVDGLARPRGLPVIFDDRLRERHYGDWSGLTLAEARAQAPERFDSDWRQAGAPGGESQAVLTARVAAVFDDIVAARPQATVAVVSHGGALSAVLGHLLGIPAQRAVSFSFYNTAVARLSVVPNGAGGSLVRLISLGDDRHLERPWQESGRLNPVL